MNQLRPYKEIMLWTSMRLEGVELSKCLKGTFEAIKINGMNCMEEERSLVIQRTPFQA